MPKNRPETGELRQPTLRPVASPVDSFVRPNASSELQELAQALSGLAPSLQRYAEDRKEDEQKRGRTDATAIYEDVKKTGQKIKTGEIAPHESKWYRAAASEQVGRLVAAAYGQDLLLATQEDEGLKDSTDPADFDSFEAQRRQEWMETHLDGQDAAFMAGFNATSAQGILNARQSFIADAANRLDGQVLKNTYTEHQVSIREALQSGLEPKQIAAQLSARNSALYLANPKLGKSLNRTTIEAVFDAARAYEDTDLLSILDHIPGGVKGSTLGLTKEAMEKREEVDLDIRVNRERRQTLEAKDEKRQRTKIVDGVYERAVAALVENPDADMRPFATELMGVDKNEASKLFRIAKGFADPTAKDDEVVAHGLFQQLVDGDLKQSDIADAFAEHQITTRTMTSLLAKLRASRGRSTTKAAIQDPLFTAYARDLDNLWVRHMGEVPGASGVMSVQQLRREWLDWLETPDGSGANEQAKVDWLQQAVERNFLRYSSGDDHQELRALFKNAKKPDAPKGAKPILPDWQSEEVVPWRAGQLEAFEQQWNDIQQKRRTKFSDGFEELLDRYKLTPKDIPAFIQAQRNTPTVRRRTDKAKKEQEER